MCAAIGALNATALAHEIQDTRIGKLTFESGYPSIETTQKLYDEMDFQRACQAYIWGIPASEGLQALPILMGLLQCRGEN